MKAMSRPAYLGCLALVVVSFAMPRVRGQQPDGEKIAPPEREALRQLIREELKAEQAAKEGEVKQAEQARSEAGKRWDLVGFFENGFRSESPDRAFSFHLGGRLDWDNAWFAQDDNLLLGSGSPAHLADGTAFRRARLRADGTVWETIDFVTEVNFANIQEEPNVNNGSVAIGSVGLTDFTVTFRDLPGGLNLRLGHFVAPFSLERYTSSNYQNFMELSSVFDAFFGPNQFQSGAMLFGSWLDDRMTGSAAFTRINKTTLNNFGFDAGDGLYATGLRLTGLPIYRDEGRTLLHVGVNIAHQALENDTITVANRMPLRGGAGPSQVPNFLATGNYFTPNGADIVDLEAALILGPFAFSGEYAVARVSDVFGQFDGLHFSDPRGNVSYQAFYVEAGYFLTEGDRRRYNAKTGTWDRTVPKENASFSKQRDGEPNWGFGAVQVVARLSYLDLVSGSPTLTPASPAAGAQAGRQRDVTVGVNWYINPQTYFMVNYVWTHVDSVVAGASGNVNGIGTRLHFDF